LIHLRVGVSACQIERHVWERRDGAFSAVEIRSVRLEQKSGTSGLSMDLELEGETKGALSSMTRSLRVLHPESYRIINEL
jgi:hypothetical protein